MGLFFHLFYPYGIILQAIAIIHFIRRRPETYWLWIVLIGGPLGALVYIVAEVLPDLGLLQGVFQGFPRRSRIHELEAIVLDNPSPGNFEELGALHLEEKNYARARECFDRSLRRGGIIPIHFTGGLWQRWGWGILRRRLAILRR